MYPWTHSVSVCICTDRIHYAVTISSVKKQLRSYTYAPTLPILHSSFLPCTPAFSSIVHYKYFPRTFVLLVLILCTWCIFRNVALRNLRATHIRRSGTRKTCAENELVYGKVYKQSIRLPSFLVMASACALRLSGPIFSLYM